MSRTPRNIADLPPEFLAPPPSPAAGAHNGDPGAADDDEFTRFLNRSLRIPQLVLPNKIFDAAVPWTPPELDLESLDAEILRSAATSTGCFLIVNHGMGKRLIEEVRVLAGSAFRLPTEKKRVVTISGEREWGFEAIEEDDEEGEEWFWWKGTGDEELAGIWPQGYNQFRNKLQFLWEENEKLANKIALVLSQNDTQHPAKPCPSQDSSAICLRKHGRRKIRHAAGRGDGDLQHDILRMLIRSSIRSHSLCIHICGGASIFCVYSKRGSVHFPVKDEAVVVTVGDNIQAWSGGLYKHVIGKPIFQDGASSSISIGLLYSHPASRAAGVSGGRIVSLTEQLMIAACLAFLYHIIAYMYACT